MLEELTEDNLADLISQNQKVLVQFSAGWCGNCRIMKPKFKKKSSENNDIPFVLVDSEKFPNSRKLADVSNLPTFAVFKNGECVNQLQTNKSELLLSFIDEATSD
ncbi:thioredoxin family protein [Opitutales bacterium]|nr:thioredoxin family protein [Opitutae bacterium]MBT7404941.1 thioredoxin family protein [Opitutae bacterium]MDC1004507.1 thioredoxin family protein [Opitutales bacterium]